MARNYTKILVAGTVIAVSLALLGVSAARSSLVYYVDVDRLVEHPPFPGARVRVHGLVQAVAAEIRRAELQARFELVGASRRLQVEFRGTIPEMFQPGREAVVEGALDAHGVLIGDLVLTKCSSKYEGQSTAGGHSAGPER